MYSIPLFYVIVNGKFIFFAAGINFPHYIDSIKHKSDGYVIPA